MNNLDLVNCFLRYMRFFVRLEEKRRYFLGGVSV